MNRYQKKPVLIIAALSVLFIALFVINIVNNRTKTAALEIEIAPSDSTVVLNQNKTGSGKRRIEPGSYTITVSRQGFATQTKQVELFKGSDEYAGFALVSNDSSTAKWYDEHPKDQKVAERVSSIDFDSHAEDNTDPILSNIPFIGPGSEYRIDYSSTDDQKKVHLVISYISLQAKDDAINWFSNNNYDINKYVITYTDLLASEYDGE